MIAPAPAQDKRPAPPVLHEPILPGLIQRCGGKACPPGTCDHEAVHSLRASGGFDHDFSRVRVHSEVDTGNARHAALQAKLRIGQVNDPLEHEANRAAEQVTRKPRLDATSPRLSRRHASSGEENRFQRSPAGSRSALREAPRVVHQVLRSPGQPLDAASRAYFEPRFGYDFSKVRIHADEQAAKSARAVDALAFTAGHHVVFGTGLYGHETDAKRKLLAHELAHTIQQSHHPDPDRGGAVLQRAPADEKSSELPELSQTDSQRLPRYIDRLFQSVTPPSMLNGATTFFWNEGGAKKKVTIPLSDLEQNDKLTFVALWKLHASKEEALKTVELYRKAAPGFVYYSFYLGKDGVVMPTSFSRVSTPNFHALWPDLKRANAEAAADIAAGFRQLGNAINPYPCTELDEEGNLRPAINFSNCALPIFLHGYSIHSSRAKPGLPSESHAPPVETESHAPPPTKPAPPKPPAAGESPKPPVATEPVPTEPAKTDPVPTEPTKTEPATTEPQKTEPKPAAVRKRVAGAAQERVKAKLAELNTEQRATQATIERLESDLHAAENKVRDLSKKAAAAERGTPERAKLVDELNQAKAALAEIKEADELGGYHKERAEQTKKEAALLESTGLKRPSLWESTKKAIRDAAEKAGKKVGGKFLDANTGEVIEGEPHYGHIYGKEHRRLVLEAAEKGMSQEQFNNWVNSHPEWFQLETEANNLSHRFEKPGID